MPMKNPPHPGISIGQELEYLNLSITQGAKALGVSRSHLHRIIQGECAISSQMALRLEAVIGGSVGLWLRVQAAYDEAQIRAKAKSVTKGLKRISIPPEKRRAA